MIGILTYHFAHNYGAMLQAYAMKRYLNENGKEAEIINYCPPAIKEQYSISNRTITVKNFWWKARNNLRRKKQYALFESFRTEKLSPSDEVAAAALGTFIKKYEIVIVGSDQVWNTAINFDDPNYFLDCADESVKRYGYAVSLGSIKTSKSMRILLERNIDKFDRVSFREKSASLFINEAFCKGYPVTCDPVFLLPVEEWKSIEKKPGTKLPARYILYYSLQNDENLMSAVIDMAKKEDLPVVSVHPLCRKAAFADYNLSDVGPSEFLWLLDNAEYVASNSFHATAFSIIFKKNAILRPHPVLGDRNKDLLNLVRGNDLLQQGDVYRFEHADLTSLNDLISYSNHYLLDDDSEKYKPVATDQNDSGAIIVGAKAKDLKKRASCQSGGAATIIAEYFIKHSAIVYGCGFDEKLNVTYHRITRTEDLSILKGSKYVRANLGDTFSSIVEDLKCNRKVLFIGNACNVAGIVKLVSNMPQKDNLFTMDFICHGTPSHELYREYLEWVEKREHKKIVSFEFRYKDMSGEGGNSTWKK